MCGDCKSLAANVLSGIQHFVPNCRHHIAASWRLYSAWGRTELPTRAPPLPKLHMLALAAYCRDQQWTSTGILLVLGFHTWLRSGELFQIRWRDVQIDPFSGRGVIVLPLTKTSARTGAQESVTIHDPWVGRLIY
eukprot:1405431-Amphidinium_carterae.1